MAFKPGQSGNPGGRKRMDPAVRDLAAENSKEALLTIIEIMKNKRAAPSTRLAAANSVMDRAFGKPTNAVELSGPGGESLRSEPAYLSGLTGQARLIAAARAIGNMLEAGKRAVESEQVVNGRVLIDASVVDAEIIEQEKL